MLSDSSYTHKSTWKAFIFVYSQDIPAIPSNKLEVSHLQNLHLSQRIHLSASIESNVLYLDRPVLITVSIHNQCFVTLNLLEVNVIQACTILAGQTYPLNVKPGQQVKDMGFTFEGLQKTPLLPTLDTKSITTSYTLRVTVSRSQARQVADVVLPVILIPPPKTSQ